MQELEMALGDAGASSEASPSTESPQFEKLTSSLLYRNIGSWSTRFEVTRLLRLLLLLRKVLSPCNNIAQQRTLWSFDELPLIWEDYIPDKFSVKQMLGTELIWVSLSWVTATFLSHLSHEQWLFPTANWVTVGASQESRESHHNTSPSYVVFIQVIHTYNHLHICSLTKWLLP